MPNRPIFLIGFMASGKTTLGKKIAKLHQVNFRDSDTEIENQTNSSINKIFKEIGENGFREIEKKWLYNALFSNEIVSLGGGLPCFNNLIEILKEKGIVIFIDTPFETIVERLETDKNRPLNNNPIEINDLYLSRLPIYNQAHYIVKNEAELLLLVEKILNIK